MREQCVPGALPPSASAGDEATKLSADLLSVPPVWPLFLQQSQLPISPAELLSVPPVWPLFLQQSQLPISSADLLSVPPVWPLFLQHAASAANLSC